MKASSAAAWLAAGLAGWSRRRRRAPGPGRAVEFADRREPGWKSYVLGHGDADGQAGPHHVDVRARDQRGGSGRSVQGPGHADLLGGRPGAGDHPRLRPRGRRPAVLHLERGHARRTGDVGHAARRLQRDARVPVDAGQHDAGAARAGRGHQREGPERHQLHRRRHAPGRLRRRRRSRRSARSRARRRCSRRAGRGDTNVKVAATTGLAAGDELRIDDADRSRSPTSARRAARRRSRPPRPRARRTSRSRASPAWSRTARSPSAARACRSQTVGTAGRQRHRPHARRAAHRRARRQRRRRALRRHRHHVLAGADRRARAAARTLLAPGTGITLRHAAGRRAGRGRHRARHAGHDDRRPHRLQRRRRVRAAARRTSRSPRRARVGNAANMIQGGERFQALTLTTPGTLQLSAVGIHFRHPNASARRLRGPLPVQRRRS